MRPVLVAVLIGMVTAAPAADLKITAEFRPTALNPSHNRFVNTTPQSGYCAQHPGLCRPGDFTIDTGIRVLQRPLVGASTDPREHWYLAADGNWRDVTVHNDGGDALPVRLRLFLVGMHWSIGSDGSAPGSYGSATGGCRGRTGIGAGSFYRYAWDVPERSAVCARRPRATTDRIAGSVLFSIGYHLETPNPLAARNGQYRGRVSYRVGNGEEIDLGQGNYTDSVLNLELMLDVAHDFSVRFAQDPPSVTLAPEGGWSQWVDHGRPPARLRQALPFHLTTSMDFSMKLRCEHDAGGRCGLRRADAKDVVPVDVDVTLPGMRSAYDGRPAQETPLLPEDARAPRFTPDGYLMQRRSTLRFTAGRDAVTDMLKSPGTHWQGNMTVVFDANP
ncbi:hypothetical protein I5U42_05325 [Stenotrophomonas maltophilia]|nr:hypothetical protein [Stenotrophomonas maltophilia]